MTSLDKLFQDIAEKAVDALIHEVKLTPKPGLVDSNNTGSHTDMNVALFIKSAHSFLPYFIKYCQIGFENADTPHLILPAIRIVGMEAEVSMFAATGGVNTHKGANFSFGVLLSSIGLFYGIQRNFNYGENKLQYGDVNTIFSLVKTICAGLVENDFAHLHQKVTLSYGEKLYLEYGFAGIRAEVEAGFPSLTAYALPYIKGIGKDKEQTYLLILLTLMQHVDDSNINNRGGFVALDFVKTESQRALLLYQEGKATLIDLMLELDVLLIEKHLSPGGCADLLALTILIDTLINS